MKTTGLALNDAGDEWSATCPQCEKEYEYQGFWDPDDVTKCSCGCHFTIDEVEFDGGKSYFTSNTQP